MPRLTHSLPKYRKHKASGQAVVTLNGRDFYLGTYGSKSSRQQYERHIAEWLQGGRTLVALDAAANELTIAMLIAAFWHYAEGYYVTPEGRPTRELANYRRVFKPLRELYGETPAANFGPRQLKVIREILVAGDLSRNTVNSHLVRLKNVFRWGVEEQLLPPATYAAVHKVKALRRGKTTARETEKIRPVATATVKATLPFLPVTIAHMVRLQYLTAARPVEICLMRPCDIDRSGEEWKYIPQHHKTQHHDKERIIYIGKKGQALLGPYLLRAADAYCFSPEDSERKRLEGKHERRTTPIGQGNRPGTNREPNPKRRPSKRYSTDSYRRAISRACESAFGLPKHLKDIHRQNNLTPEERKSLQAEASEWRRMNIWKPNQLRHTRATQIRRKFGPEAAQVVLGHSDINTTERYAEVDRKRATKVMRKIG